MLSFLQVSLLLLLIWTLFYKLLKNKVHSCKGYFVLLFVMASAGIVLPLEDMIDLDFYPEFSVFGIVLFALLLISAIVPWLRFDNYLKNVSKFQVNPQYIKVLNSVMVTMIILSVFAIVYTLPYAVTAYKMGAADVRSIIKEQSLLPKSPLTTIAVGVGLLTPVYVLLFYISLLTEKLKNKSKYLFLGSLTYLVTSASFQARDGFVFIPLTYYFLFVVFKKSIPEFEKEKILKTFRYLFPVLLSFLMLISIERFYKYNSDDSLKSLIAGTWGYFYQQPYVFDMNIQPMQFFQGLGHRFELFAQIFDFPVSQDFIPTYKFEWMFGTMYSSFYSAEGWFSLFVASLFFVFSWTFIMHLLIKNNNHFGVLLVFSLYVYFLISGLFYFRFSAVSITIVYILLVCSSLLLNKYDIVRGNDS